MTGDRSLEDYVRRPAEELFDLEADPREVKNLADDPAYDEIRLDFRRRMEEWQRATKDPWLFRDGMSLPSIEHQVAEGLEIPDRWDMEVGQSKK
jgi:N-sulfoglucosamine sulfohydrolase